MHNATPLLVGDEAEIIKLMQIHLENERYRLLTEFPIIMLSAKGQGLDKITGLSVGVDDYVTKSFSPLERVIDVCGDFSSF
ncbi:hypothetical protein PAECIP111894_00888 [Paenibacillus pseudetheri]|uniref:Response regulatory domain-containing protein n=1 Tax=Paenibacillus pseudetheri TaxID=2897682 RepID=A0ABM9B981_9BACL|nr:hypothetical protein PAECIP111894_00888 [Paenibacillus pseudetheri]